jgi:transposase
MTKETRNPEFTQEFRDSVVKMVVEQKQKVIEVAERLGVPASKVYYWVRQRKEKHAFGKGKAEDRGKSHANAQKIRELEKKLERVTQERDILKKAAAYFAKFPD